MRTSGKITEEYISVASPSGRSAPRDTELYGQFRSMEDAEEEQKSRGGRIVRVMKTTTWTLAESSNPNLVKEVVPK